jgi:hypothetical protein
MPRKPPHARIAITLPPETLREADALAARLDRSRSWVVAEAIRQFADAHRAAAPSGDASAAVLGASRHEQLRRDAGVTAEARVLLGEEVQAVGAPPPRPEAVRSFPSFDAFRDWRRQRDAR